MPSRALLRTALLALAGLMALGSAPASSIVAAADDGAEDPFEAVVEAAQLTLAESRELVDGTLDDGLAAAVDCDDLDDAACLLPFPNDRFTRGDAGTATGLRIDLPTLGTPRNAAGKPIDTTEWNRNDGFSPGSLILTVVPHLDLQATGAPDLTDIPASLDDDSPIVLLNADTGERHPFFAELDAKNDDPERTPLLIRPAVNLEHGDRYIVALRNLVDTDGERIGAPRSFTNLRDGSSGRGEPPNRGRRAQLDEMLTTLETHTDVERDELYLAWDFTVASADNLFERAVHMRDDAFADLGDDAPNFVVTDVRDGASDHIARRIEGRIEVPNYLDRPLGPPTSRLNNHLDADGVPDRFAGDGTVWAPFWCNVPTSTTPDPTDPDAAVDPGRAGLYGHGLLGSGSQVFNGYVQTFATEHNYAFCATDWWGMATEDLPNIGTILADMSNFATLPDRAQQGFLNFLFIGRAMIHPDGFLADEAFQSAGGQGLWDADDLFYYGNSQGGIMGGALMALSQDFTRGVLGVPGMNYSTLLDRSTGWAPYEQVFSTTYPDRLDQQIVFSMIQMLWDRGEANGYAHHIIDPYDDATPEKRVMLQVALADHQVTHTSAEVQARTMGAHVHAPTLLDEPDPGVDADVEFPRHHDREPYWGIPDVPYGADGRWDGSALMIWDSGNDVPPVENVNPAADDAYPDPHGHPRVDPDAMHQMSAFLRTGGALEDVCFGPCLSMQHPYKDAPHRESR
jgi:hypothetical protein